MSSMLQAFLLSFVPDKLDAVSQYRNRNTALEIVQVALESLSKLLIQNRHVQDRFINSSGINQGCVLQKK